MVTEAVLLVTVLPLASLMVMTGWRLADLGDDFTWNDLRDFIANLPPSHDSALYRVRHPQSWWWTPEIEFLGAVMTAIQWGNWWPRPAPR
jgi:hypothetical protein